MPPKRKRLGALDKQAAPKRPRTRAPPDHLKNLLKATTCGSATEGNPEPQFEASTDEEDEVLVEAPSTPQNTPEPTKKKRSGRGGKRDNAGAKRKKGTFRYCAASALITFPQCDTSKEVCLENILAEWKDIVRFVVIAEEKHENGDPHLHIVVKFNCQYTSDNCHFFEFISGGKHGSVEPVKTMKHAIQYVMKDGNFITYGNLPKGFTTAGPEQKVKVGDSVVKLIDEGATPEVVRKAFPLYWMMHNKKIQEYYNAVQAEAQAKLLPKFPGFVVPSPIADPYGHAVATWINDNFMKPRSHKQLQLWVCGPPNIGKTHIAMQLKEYFQIYEPARNSNYYDGFSEDVHKAIIFDEFKGNKTITEMNQLVEGTDMLLHARYAFVRKSAKKGNCPVIVFSNFSPKEAYPNVTDQALAPLLVRFKVVQVIDDDYRFGLTIAGGEPDLRPGHPDDDSLQTTVMTYNDQSVVIESSSDSDSDSVSEHKAESSHSSLEEIPSPFDLIEPRKVQSQLCTKCRLQNCFCYLMYGTSIDEDKQ